VKDKFDLFTTERSMTVKKRYLAAILVILCGLVAYSQRGAIALQILPRAMESAMSTNALRDLGDGLHITLCGAGGPLPDPRRSGACVAIIAGEKMFIVDAGTNGLRNLNRLRYNPGNIAAVFLTHFHSDHIDGLGELATIRWVSGNHNKPLPVYGPDGVADIVSGFNKSYSQDSVYRNDHHSDMVAPLSGHGMVALSFPVPAAGESTIVYEHEGLKIEMISVGHFPVVPAVGYLFSYQGRTALISGDTVKSANIELFAKGIDLLVHEALSPKLVGIMNQAAQKTGNIPLAKITSDILDYHASPVEAAETARAAEVGHLLYYHIVPPLIFPGTEAVWLEGVDEIFTNFTLGVDGTTFSLPPNSKEILKVRSEI
jgi:ribonuclease Z